ncbi:MAG: GNAT family N-acetyltransferase [Pseudomonadota bacterium]
MNIRPAAAADSSAILKIILPVFRTGETYTIDPEISEEAAIAYWMGIDKETFVAVADGEIVGTYYMKANQGGGGKHICNCGYMTADSATGKGVASAMCEHSIDHAKSAGFRGMQFNFVVSTNRGAISLWEKYGFEIVGTLPGAFAHATEGYVDAFIMFRAL